MLISTNEAAIEFDEQNKQIVISAKVNITVGFVKRMIKDVCDATGKQGLEVADYKVKINKI